MRKRVLPSVVSAQPQCNATLAAALGALRAAREEDSASRSALLRAEETFTALEAKVNALEALESERVGLAPAAAKLLDERDRFGEGAIIGPLSDFISADADAAALVERYLGATVHAVLVRDRFSCRCSSGVARRNKSGIASASAYRRYCR